MHWVQPGDNCWELARANGWTLEKFKEVNPKIVCESLMPGTSVCLPVKDNLVNAPSKAKAGSKLSQTTSKRRKPQRA